MSGRSRWRWRWRRAQRREAQFTGFAPWLCHHPRVSRLASGVDQGDPVRVGDSDRDECVEALTEHHVHGRLSVDELDRRHRAALVAVTEADLAALLADLPGSNSTLRPLVLGHDWWSLDPKVRAMRMARWAATPVSLAAGGVLVASASTQTDENNFVVGLAASALGYLTHMAITRWSGKEH
jgi:hypothetical protein